MRLKLTAIHADGLAMFSATTQPLPLSEACLQCLCASLNAPVVHTDGLPVSPARAVVVVYAEQYGDLGMAIAIRSLEGGEVVLIRSREPLPPETPPARALETAIGFAEGLGFVFDEDMLAADDSHPAKLAALEHWQGLLAGSEVFEAADVVSPPGPEGGPVSEEPELLLGMDDLLSGAAGAGDEPEEIDLDELSLGGIGPDDLETGGDELLLDDIAPLEVGDGELVGDVLLEGEAQPDSAAPQGAARAGRPVGAEVTEPIALDEAREEAAPQARAFAASPLSKFRSKAGEETPATEADEREIAADDEAAGGGSALGRVKIVRMRKSRDGRAPARARVLGHY